MSASESAASVPFSQIVFDLYYKDMAATKEEAWPKFVGKLLDENVKEAKGALKTLFPEGTTVAVDVDDECEAAQVYLSAKKNVDTPGKTKLSAGSDKNIARAGLETPEAMAKFDATVVALKKGFDSNHAMMAKFATMKAAPVQTAEKKEESH